MAPTEGMFAMPERRWDCRRGTPVIEFELIWATITWLHYLYRRFLVSSAFVPYFARPIPSVRLSVRLFVWLSVTSRSTAKSVRHKCKILTMGSQVTIGLLRGLISNPYDHPFPKLGTHNQPSIGRVVGSPYLPDTH